MSYAVKIHPLAEADAIEAAFWYDQQVPGLGEDFFNEVNAAAGKLRQNAEIYRVRFDDVRCLALQRFKFYGLFYVIRASEVLVIGIPHGMRNPKWLQKRRKDIG